MKTLQKNQIEFTRINNDTNGNPRFVCHFLAFINANERGYTYAGETIDPNKPILNLSLDAKYLLALKKSRQLGGRKFHNKQYGGGIVFQMYQGEQEEKSNRINEIKNS